VNKVLPILSQRSWLERVILLHLVYALLLMSHCYFFIIRKSDSFDHHFGICCMFCLRVTLLVFDSVGCASCNAQQLAWHDIPPWFYPKLEQCFLNLPLILPSLVLGHLCLHFGLPVSGSSSLAGHWKNGFVASKGLAHTESPTWSSTCMLAGI